MFGNLINEIFFKQVDLIVLLDAFLDSLGQVFDRGHERHFSFHFLSPTVGFNRFGRVDSGRPTSFGVVHGLVSIGDSFGVNNMLGVLRNVVQVREIRVSN